MCLTLAWILRHVLYIWLIFILVLQYYYTFTVLNPCTMIWRKAWSVTQGIASIEQCLDLFLLLLCETLSPLLRCSPNKHTRQGKDCNCVCVCNK